MTDRPTPPRADAITPAKDEEPGAAPSADLPVGGPVKVFNGGENADADDRSSAAGAPTE